MHYSTEKLRESEKSFLQWSWKNLQVPAKIYTFRDTVLKAITEHANAVLKPGVHSNGVPKDQESISVVDKLAIELFQA